MPPPPGMMPNPAFQQWLQQAQQAQGVIAENAKRQKQFDDAVALLKRDGLTGFRLDIETDSTIAPDEQAEKQARIEFMQQFVPLMAEIVPMARGNPAIAELAKQAVLFAVRGFRVARQLEEQIEKAFDAVAQMPPDPATTGDKGKGAPPPNPLLEAAKVQADMHDADAKAQTDMAAVVQRAQEAAQNVQLKQAQLVADQQENRDRNALAAAELAQRERFEQARMMRPPTPTGAR